MNPLWLLRMKRWIQNPPTWRTVRLVLALVAVLVAMAAVEAIWGWPAWLTPERIRP